MSLASLYSLLSLKKAQLARLQACQGKLGTCQQSFYQYERYCTEPPLTPTTWHGNLANQLDNIRESGVLASYRDIAGPQFSRAFSVLSAKISSLQSEISSLQATIAYREAELARQAAERRKG